MVKITHENEIKILDVDVVKLQNIVESLGAKKVFDAERVFTTFDTLEKTYTKNHSIIRLTEEEKLKLSISDFPDGINKETIKLFVSRKKEAIDLFAKLGIMPICEVTSHRISYELDGVDIDIDQFPFIPPFIEIDTSELEMPLKDFLIQLDILDKEQFLQGTEDLYFKYGKNYFEIFAIK